MSRRIGFVPIIAAASLAVAGCEQRAAEAPAEDATQAEAGGAQPKAASAGGAPTGGTCGTLAGIDCASRKDFCKMPMGQCGVQDAKGICTSTPQICTRDYRPVCGCDGKTYGNACEADRARVSVSAPGECRSPG